MGFVAQDDVFPEGLSVQDIVRARLDGESLEDHEKETRISKVLTRTGFDDFDKPAHLLSGGWRKRLGIAREMALEPDLLLLDEPTNHLDIPGIVWLQKLLRASPFGYLVATHDRAFLRGVADEILEINKVYPGGFYRAPETMMNFLTIGRSFLMVRRACKNLLLIKFEERLNGWAEKLLLVLVKPLPALTKLLGEEVNLKNFNTELLILVLLVWISLAQAGRLASL